MYLNVEAGVATAEGRISTTMAIPIHVGAVDTSPVEHGELETNEDGDNGGNKTDDGTGGARINNKTASSVTMPVTESLERRTAEGAW